MLEPYEWKHSRTVLRRESGSNPADLVDKLRDLGDALGFTVDYDADSNTAIVLSKGSTAVYRPDHDPQI